MGPRYARTAPALAKGVPDSIVLLYSDLAILIAALRRLSATRNLLELGDLLLLAVSRESDNGYAARFNESGMRRRPNCWRNVSNRPGTITAHFGHAPLGLSW